MKLVLAKSVQKQYKRLPKPEQTKIKKKLTLISGDPLAGKKLEGELKGRRVIRTWPYRIIYSINEVEQRIEISDIFHRQRAYK